MAGQATREAWSHARIQEIELPSGAGTAAVEAVDLTESVVVGRIANPLRGIALKAEGGKLDKGAFDEDDAGQWLELQCAIVSLAVKWFRPHYGGKGPKPPKDTGPFEPDWVRDHMPPIDRERIFYVATHVVTADTMKGLMSLGSFRSGPGGPDATGGRNGDRAGTE